MLVLALLGAVLFTGAAAAAILELGSTASRIVTPSCPSNVSAAKCTIILTQVTALETIRDGAVYPTTVRKSGYVVAFTLGLSQLSTDRKSELADIRYLDRTYGGTTQAAVAILSPVGKASQHTWKLKAESPVYHLQPYLGTVVQFPLRTALPVAKGDVVALTVPTWAPVLSIDLANKSFAYRQSRSDNCSNPPASDESHSTVGTSVKYGCDYPGTRVEYSATEITSPQPPKNYVR